MTQKIHYTCVCIKFTFKQRLHWWPSGYSHLSENWWLSFVGLFVCFCFLCFFCSFAFLSYRILCESQWLLWKRRSYSVARRHSRILIVQRLKEMCETSTAFYKIENQMSMYSDTTVHNKVCHKLTNCRLWIIQNECKTSELLYMAGSYRIDHKIYLLVDDLSLASCRGKWSEIG